MPDDCRRRGQRETFERRGRKKDSLRRTRLTFHTGAGLLTEKQRARLEALFAAEQHVEVGATWEASTSGWSPAHQEPDRKPGRTLNQRAADILAFFEGPGTSNGSIEAICESGFGWSGTVWSEWMSVALNTSASPP